MAFSWISTVNLFIYLIILVTSSVVHQKRDDTVWNAQVRSYPWYFNYCHRLGSSPEIPAPYHDRPIQAPQPQRPILLLRRSMLSSLSRLGRRPERESSITEHSTRQSVTVTQQARPPSMLFTTLYPLHVQAALGPTVEPPLPALPPRATHYQHFRNSLTDSGGPPPLMNWPRPDIMSQPLPKRAVSRKKVPASERPSASAAPRETREGLPPSLP